MASESVIRSKFNKYPVFRNMKNFHGFIFPKETGNYTKLHKDYRRSTKSCTTAPLHHLTTSPLNHGAGSGALTFFLRNILAFRAFLV